MLVLQHFSEKDQRNWINVVLASCCSGKHLRAQLCSAMKRGFTGDEAHRKSKGNEKMMISTRAWSTTSEKKCTISVGLNATPRLWSCYCTFVLLCQHQLSIRFLRTQKINLPWTSKHNKRVTKNTSEYIHIKFPLLNIITSSQYEFKKKFKKFIYYMHKSTRFFRTSITSRDQAILINCMNFGGRKHGTKGNWLCAHVICNLY